MSGSEFIEVRQLRRSFGGVVAVRDVTFTCSHGERLGVIGPNGAGKSTLFAMLAGAIPPSGGSISFDGRKVDGSSASSLARLGVARTFQIPRPFVRLTTIENVAIAAHLKHRRSADAFARAEEVLSRVGLKAAARRPANELNLGDLKLLELARAYATEPRLLLLDEVGAGLSRPEQERLSALICSMNEEEGITVIFVEHVLPIVRAVAQRLLVLHQGSVMAEGDTESVLNDTRVISAYLGNSC